MFDVKVISLKDMILNALLKWRVIVVVAVLAAVLFPAFMINNGKNNTDSLETEVDTDQTEEQATISSQMASIIALSDLYKTKNIIENQVETMSKLEIERGTLKCVYINYFIDTNKENPINTVSLGPLYFDVISSDKSVCDILDAEGIDIDPALFIRYITVNSSNDSLMIKIPCTEDTDVNKMVSGIKTTVANKTKELQNSYKFSLKVVDEGIVYLKNDRFVQERNDLDSKRNSVDTSIVNTMKGMTEKQINLSKELSDGNTSVEMAKTDLEKSISEKDKNTTDIVQPTVGIGSVAKYAIIGLILGALFSGIVLCILFIMSNRLHSVVEFARKTGIIVVGCLELPSRNRLIMNGLDDWIRFHLHSNKRKLNKHEQINEICEALTLIKQINKTNSVRITSSIFGKIDDDLVAELTSSIRDKVFDAEYVDSIALSKSSLKACANTDGIIIVEQVNNSRLREIENEIVAAREYGINILGAIVLE